MYSKLNKMLHQIFPQGLPQWEVYENPFGEEYSAKILLYPTMVCMLEENHYGCLQKFMKSLGEQDFAITDLLRLNGYTEHEPTWEVFPCGMSFEEVDSHRFMPTTAFCSCNASWGLIISDSEYAIIAAKEEFRRELFSAFRPCRSEWKILVEEQPCSETDQMLRWVGIAEYQ